MDSLASRFYAGRFTEIVADFIDAPDLREMNAATAVYVLGALCFLSRVPEAESLFAMFRDKMSDRQRIESSYYLITALRRERRASSSVKARMLLGPLLRQCRRSALKDDHSLFFAYCSIAFFRYIDGRFSVALPWAQRAYDHAFRANFQFGRLVSYELIGHCQLIVGQARAGLKNLKASGALAESLGRGAIKQAVEVATRLYRSTYGLAPARELLDELSGAIRACAFENSYTLASLYIELARLSILAGHGDKAEAALRDAGEWVYRLDMPFLDANLSFRYAHLMALQGDHKKALELVRSARARASEANDASAQVGVLGLEARILRELGSHAAAEEIEGKIRFLGERSGKLIAKRINYRLGISGDPQSKRGEDMLGDLFDEIAADAIDVRSRVLESGFLGLIPGMIGLPQFSEAIVFGFKGDSVSLLSRGMVRHDADGWPDLVKKLVLAFAENRKMQKEEIAEAVWRQSYNPLRHDPLIYALIARARKTLETCEGWLTVSDGVYSLRDTVIIRDVTVRSVAGLSDAQSPKDLMQIYPNVSLRQAKILDLCSHQGTISNKDVCKAFEISEVTAGRDLAELVDKKLLLRFGKGRATSYSKA